MASEVELERLVVRLIGDATTYRKMLQDAEQETQAAMGNIVSIVAQGSAAIGGAAFLKGTFASFSEGEHVTLQLRAALEANQREVESTIADYEEFALQMQRATTFSDEHIKTLLKVSETYNFTGEQAKEMTKQSMALAAATGGEAQSMMRLVAAVTRGNEEDLAHLEMYKRMIPQLRMAHSQEEQLEVIRRLTATGTKLLAAESETAAGKLKQLNEEWDNAKEQLGAVVAEGLKPVVGNLKEIVVWFQNTDPAIKTVVVTVAGLTAAVVSLKAAWTALQMIGVSGTVLGWAGALGLAATAAVAITSKIIQGTEAFKSYQSELEKIKSGGAAGAASIKAGGSQALERAASETDPKARMAVLSEEADKAKKLEQVYQEGRDRAKEMYDRHKEERSALQALYGMFGSDPSMNVYQEGLDAANARLVAAQGNLRQLTEEQKRFAAQADPAGRKKQLEEEIANQNKYLKINQDLGKAAKDRGDAGAAGGFAKSADANKAKAAALVEEWKKVDAVMRGVLFGQAKEDMDKLTASLRTQIDTWSMTEDEAKLYAVQLKHGLNPAQMEEAQDLIEVKQMLGEYTKAHEEAKEAAKKLQEETANVSKALEREIDVLLLGAEAAKLKELAEQGVDEAMLGHIAGMQEEKKFLEENKKLREEAEQIINRGAGSDPETKYGMELEKLEEALRRGVIDQEMFQAGLSYINDELEKSQKTAKGAKDEVQKFDAALSNSAEAGKRVGDFYSKLADQYAKVGKKSKGKGQLDQQLEFVGGEGLMAQPGEFEQEMAFRLQPDIVDRGREGLGLFRRRFDDWREGDMARGGVAGGGAMVQLAQAWDKIEPLQAIAVDEEKKQVKVLEDILKAVKDNNMQIVFEAADFE